MDCLERGWTGRVSAYAGALLLSSALSSPALAQAQQAEANGNEIEAIIVTAQRKEESLQKVPIAVSAFSQDQLQKSKLDGAPDLVKSIPNVNFSKGNFVGSNFTIRGIGSKLVAGSGDTATGIHLNNTPLTANNLFEAEFFDVERVEVLRGPQGTLYGRNATGGIVNVITNKAKFDVNEGMGHLEYGSYNTIRARGMVNIPLGEMFAFRAAGVFLDRDGFGDNLVTGNDVDNRHLWNTRVTLGFKPDDTFSVYLLWDHFKESDRRSRQGKQYCAKDTGLANVGGVPYSANPAIAGIQRGFFTQGCKAVSVYSPDALGTLNSQATLTGLFGLLGGFQTGDSFAGKMQDPDIRNIESPFDPRYRSKTDIYQVSADWDVTDNLRVSALASRTYYDLSSLQDFFRYTPSVPFNAMPNPLNTLGAANPATFPTAYATLFPGGVFNDPQLGVGRENRVGEITAADAKQTTAELRLQSSFDGPFNFSFGANYLKYGGEFENFVMFNTGTAWYQLNNLVSSLNSGGRIPFPCPVNNLDCVYVDPGAEPDRSGHNYFNSYTPYHLRSTAVFGEVYYRISDDLKFTGGLRYTDDRKVVDNHAGSTGVKGSGVLGPRPGTPAQLIVGFEEFTGRAGLDWSPDLEFTNSTLVYGFYSRGYKSGGLNTPCMAGPGVICGPPTFKPEFINSYEIGAKNTLADGRVQLNLGFFYYDYNGYQISKIVNRASTNENIDAKVKGAEFESVWLPMERLRLNANVGYLDTSITNGLSVDLFDRTGSNPLLTLVKTSAASNCVVTTAAAAAALTTSNASTPFSLLSLCTVSNFTTAGTPLIPGGPLAAGSNAAGALVSDGIVADLKGKKLPNAPKWTVSLGAQYSFAVSDDLEMTIRGDYYYQASTFTRIYNIEADRLKSWDNVNLTMTLASQSKGWQVDAFVKNALNEKAITDTYLADDTSALLRNAFYTEPRTVGIGVTYRY